MSSSVSHKSSGKAKKSKVKSAKKVQPYPVSVPVPTPTPVKKPVVYVRPAPIPILPLITISSQRLDDLQSKAERDHPGQLWKQLVTVKWGILSEYTRWFVILASSDMDEKSQLEFRKQLVIEPKDHSAVAWLARFNEVRTKEAEDESEVEEKDEEDLSEYITWCRGPGPEQKGCEVFFRPPSDEDHDEDDKCKICDMKGCDRYIARAWCKDCHLMYATRIWSDDNVKAVLRSSMKMCSKCDEYYQGENGRCSGSYMCVEKEE